MKRLRVLVVTQEDLIPPESAGEVEDRDHQPWRTEYDVLEALHELGHEARILGVSHDLAAIREAVEEWHPDIVFNLLIEFHDIGAFQVHVASYFELLKLPYTGCNPRGLLLARDKALCKKILGWHRIPTPSFAVCRLGRRVRLPRKLRFPLIVKSVDEDASLGVSQASIVAAPEELAERVAFVHANVGTDALAEEYVEGRELTIGVLGNERLTTFPVWEMFFENLPKSSHPIATARAKWDAAYQLEAGIMTGRAEELPPGVEDKLARTAKRIYRALGLSGFARMDVRLDEAGKLWIIEANPNPDLTRIEDFAQSADWAGVPYPDLIQRILNLGLRQVHA